MFQSRASVRSEDTITGRRMIIKLPKILVDQIAAGEVVVRPASVVKELIENSIDAHARHVAVTVGNALRDVAVVDDGIGMSREDAELALERHATSKIQSLDDLQTLRTRGFRGEALPSVAAVSRLALTTRRPEDLAATRIVVEGGRIAAIEQVGAPPGTHVAARDLFYNTPARLKFLKGPAAELAQISRVIVRQALAASATAFRFVNQQRVFLDLPADQSLESRTRQLLAIAGDNLLEVEFEKYDLRVRGFIAKPIEARRDRRHQFFFVNGRPITHRTLFYSVEQAYAGTIISQHYPVVVLFVELSPDEVDVNVHPTKEEVRFRDENKVVGLVHRAVAEALHAANLAPHIRLPDIPPAGVETTAPPKTSPADYQAQFVLASQALQIPAAPYQSPLPRRDRLPEGEARPAPRLDSPPPFGKTTEVELAPITGTAPPAEDEIAAPSAVVSSLPENASPRAITQIADTYIVAQTADGLLLIDQHAAHERLLYMRAQEQKGRLATQPLLVPISVEIRPGDRPLMDDLAPVLAEMGFETEAFGGHTFIVRSVPAMFDRLDVPALISDLLDDLAGESVTREGERLRERVLTRLACHAAIKAGQRLQTAEMQQLIDELLAARLSFTCPHGRPTMIFLTRDQLDRQFKRK
jgi:DNA mismatch repair protein MutL